MVTDLHCHFPMHLMHGELDPEGGRRGWWADVEEAVKQKVFDLAARAFNAPPNGDPWQVGLPSLRAGGYGTVCSVLYRPDCELPPLSRHPAPGSFAALMQQLNDVERHLAGEATVVLRAADLDAQGLRFVHCVEGGFHLGPDADEIAEHVAQLAARGVFYITLAHLFFRGVAANAPAIPFLSDGEYDLLFGTPGGTALTPLGEAALAAMVDHHVVPDISHMREDAVSETLDILARLDPDNRLPVIATHVGARSAGPDDLEYNLACDTMRQVADRGGVIGVILAQHILGETKSEGDARDAIRRHIQAIHEALDTHDHTAIGTDLDGFIKPTLTGIDHAGDLRKVEGWLREDFPDAAEAILHGNADRVLRMTFALR